MKIDVIAEIGWNHLGDMELAKKMIIAAAENGATIAKFQSWSTKRLKEGVWDEDGRKEIYKRAELSLDQHLYLQSICENNEIEFMSSAFSVPDAELLKSIGCHSVKIPSFDSRNTDLIKFCDKNFKNVYISFGTCTIAEMTNTISLFKTANVHAMHCVSIYPGKYELTNLPRMQHMIQILPQINPNVKAVGFSDHIDGIDSVFAALAMGANVIEKHFTIDKNLEGRDNHFSILPNQLRDITLFSRNLEKMMINHGDNYLPGESETRTNYAGRFNKH